MKLRNQNSHNIQENKKVNVVVTLRYTFCVWSFFIKQGRVPWFLLPRFWRNRDSKTLCPSRSWNLNSFDPERYDFQKNLFLVGQLVPVKVIIACGSIFLKQETFTLFWRLFFLHRTFLEFTLQKKFSFVGQKNFPQSFNSWFH